MLRENDIIKRIAKRKDLDPRVVGLIARYPFSFVKKVMSDREDLKPVRIRYFGLFVLKPKYYTGRISKNYNKSSNTDKITT